jgi:hypothetical protein
MPAAGAPRKKDFFFEKKKQKTFTSCGGFHGAGWAPIGTRQQETKVFCLF